MQTNNQTPQQQQSKALAPIQKVEVIINEQEGSFNELISSYKAMIQFKSEAHFALQAMQKNDFLMNTAVSNPNSLKNAILNVASIGLSLNPAERQAYLVPRDGAVCLDVGYIGFVDLATQSGSLKWVQAKLVHKNDQYLFQGVGKEPLHTYASFSDRGPIVGVYCVALTQDGQYLTEEMSLAECHEIRNRTYQWKKNQAGPWKTDEGEMMKKTVIKRAAKLWPKAPDDNRLARAIQVVNEHEGIQFEREEQPNTHKEKMLARKAEHEQLINVSIKELCGALTNGMTVEEKGKFIREHLGVSAYSNLRACTNEQLKEIADNLNKMLEEKLEETYDQTRTDTDLQ